MSKHPVIKSLLTSFLLVLFALSVTPKRFVHDVVAKHKDVAGRFANETHTHVQKAFYSCHVDDLVVESPFLPGIAPIAPVPVQSTVNRYAEREIRIVTLFPVFLSLRGPPTIA